MCMIASSSLFAFGGLPWVRVRVRAREGLVCSSISLPLVWMSIHSIDIFYPESTIHLQHDVFSDENYSDRDSHYFRFYVL